MAEYETIRSVGAGTRAAQIDVGLRAHMNKVYGLMSVGMLLTGLMAWAIAGMSVSSVPTAEGLQIGA
ncbi:MAG TPA: BAX inhibitor (BI)-1/YccA family protein, partial [Paracoccaceae bacterium]